MTNYEWIVTHVLPARNGLKLPGELQRSLNLLDEDGWEIFSVFDYVIVARKPIKQNDSTSAKPGDALHG